MTQKEKDLLLKDLCARLPYGVKVLCLRDFNHEWYNLESVNIGTNEVYVTTYESYANRYVTIEAVKPYLFPLSSMTEEQKEELRRMDAFVNSFGQICFSTYDDYGHELIPTFEDAIRITNWLNKNHFDYRGLIEKGLAIDATGLNVY